VPWSQPRPLLADPDADTLPGFARLDTHCPIHALVADESCWDWPICCGWPSPVEGEHVNCSKPAGCSEAVLMATDAPQAPVSIDAGCYPTRPSQCAAATVCCPWCAAGISYSHLN